MSRYKKIKPLPGKIPLFLASTCLDDECYKMPELDQINDPSSYNPEDIQVAGELFMKRIMERCSGTFVSGMRKVMDENPRHFTYVPTKTSVG